MRDLAEVTGSDDVLICPISSRLVAPPSAVVRIDAHSPEFLTTNLKGTSDVLVTKLFTCDRRIIARRLGFLPDETFDRVRRMLRGIICPGSQ